MLKNRPDSWIGRKKPCGCVVSICVDEPSMAKEVARMIRDGLDVTKVRGDQLDAIFDEPTFLSCPHNGNDNPDQLAFDLGDTGAAGE